MRTLFSILASALLLAPLGCQTTPNSVAASSKAPVPTDIGPVPGPPGASTFRANPLNGDAVALQDGRRLFNWYNCSGCHGGHAGAAWGPVCAMQSGFMEIMTIRSLTPSPKAAPTGCRRGAPGSRISRSGSSSLMSNPCGTSQEPDPPVEPADEQVPDPDRDAAPGKGQVTQ